MNLMEISFEKSINEKMEKQEILKTTLDGENSLF